MNTDERERFRLNLLLQLAAVGEVGVPISSLLVGAKLGGFDAANEAIVRGELVYLADKQLVVAVTKLLSPENKRWRILAAGRDALAEAGLA